MGPKCTLGNAFQSSSDGLNEVRPFWSTLTMLAVAHPEEVDYFVDYFVKYIFIIPYQVNFAGKVKS